MRIEIPYKKNKGSLEVTGPVLVWSFVAILVLAAGLAGVLSFGWMVVFLVAIVTKLVKKTKRYLEFTRHRKQYPYAMVIEDGVVEHNGQRADLGEVDSMLGERDEDGNLMSLTLLDAAKRRLMYINVPEIDMEGEDLTTVLREAIQRTAGSIPENQYIKTGKIMMKQWTVILPTRMMYDYDKAAVRPMRKYSQYRFTLDEALGYICREEAYYNVETLILHNVPLRNALRSEGVDAVVDKLLDIAPNSDGRLRRELEEFRAKYRDRQIGGYDIQVYAIEEDVTLLGQVFHGLTDIEALVEISKVDGGGSCSRMDKDKVSSRIHVGELWHRYPCFDSSDYDYENRSYETLVLRDHPVTEDEMLRLEALPQYGNYRRIGETLPADMLPMVYYNGDDGFMLVATAKE